jgi:hypothetical protein
MDGCDQLAGGIITLHRRQVDNSGPVEIAGFESAVMPTIHSRNKKVVKSPRHKAPRKEDSSVDNLAAAKAIMGKLAASPPKPHQPKRKIESQK